ncbi:hypothetical protein [Bartonella apihabitans]|uniref:hypothetical protein n=1 Tax=Bartonella apihabitans TaxID=2750929 RepID=UPI003BB65F3A
MTSTKVETKYYANYGITIYKIGKVFGYEIFSLNSYKIAIEVGFISAEDAFKTAEKKLYEDLCDQYDIELTKRGVEELREFLEENFKDFDPDRLGFFVEELTDSKRDEGIGGTGTLEIDSHYSKTGHPVIFDAGDEYFQVRKLG